MAVRRVAAASLAAFERLGIGIKRTTRQQLHVGILYSLDGGAVRMCHYAFHMDLRDELASGVRGLFWANAGLDASNRRVVAAWVANLYRNRSSIPYGFDSSGCCFDLTTAEFLPPPLGKGLTCATFILGVFGTLGHKLIDIEEWPQRADDMVWQRDMLTTIRTYCHKEGMDSADYTAALERDVGAQRVRPDEIAAAVLSSPYPVPFASVTRIAEEIRHDIESATP